MTYVPETWVDYTTPCIDATGLNNMEGGIDRAQGDVMVLYDLTANIPVTDPLLVGRLFIETDLLLRTWRDNGAGWDLAITPGGGVWVYIAETILGAPAATVTFAAIPGTYRVLVMLNQLRTDLAAEGDWVAWRANADAGNNYDYRFIGEVAQSGRAGTEARMGTTEAANSRASCFGNHMTWWEGYALVDREKFCFTPIAGRVGDLSADADIDIFHLYSHWRSTVAITSLTLLPVTGNNFVAGSRFTLYGIT